MATKRIQRVAEVEAKVPAPATPKTEPQEQSTETAALPYKLTEDKRVEMLDNGNVLCHFSFDDLEVKELTTRALMHLETWLSSLPSAPGTIELLCKLTHLCLVNAPKYSDYEVFAESLAQEDFDVLALVSYQFRRLNKFKSPSVL